MRVLLDAYWWHSGPTSLQRAVRKIVTTWHEEYPADEITILVRKPKRDQIRHATPDGVDVVETRVWPQSLCSAIVAPLQGQIKSSDFIITQNFAPLFGRSGVLIHDLLFETNPEWFTRSERIYFAPMKRLAKRARWIYATTETEGRRIAHYTKSSKKVCVVGMGVGDELDSVVSVPHSSLIPKTFLLCVGRINIRKNLEQTIRSVSATGVLSPEFPMVIVGETSGRSEHLGESIQQMILDRSLIFLGFVPDDQLRWLYENTRLLIFLSLGEGFGLPPVEAARMGTEILVSDLDIFRETLGSNAHFVNPNNSKEIQLKVSSILERLDLKNSNTSAFDRYNWQHVVGIMRETINLQE